MAPSQQQPEPKIKLIARSEKKAQAQVDELTKQGYELYETNRLYYKLRKKS